MLRIGSYLIAACAFVYLAAPAAADDADHDACMAGYRSSAVDDASVAACDRFIAAAPASKRELAIAYEFKGFVAIRHRDYAAAIASCSTAIDTDPAYAQGYMMRARALRLSGQYERAVADAGVAMGLSPKDSNPVRERALARVELGDFAGALTDLDLFASMNSPDVLGADYYIAHARALNGTKDFTRALADFDAALKLAPKAKAALAGRCVALTGTGAPQATIADCNTAAASAGDLALCTDPKQDAEERAGACDRVVAGGVVTGRDLARAYQARGDAFANRHEADKALAEYDQAIKTDPTFADARMRRAASLENQHQPDAAILEYTEVIRLVPNYVPAYMRRGNDRIDTGDLDGALADLDHEVRPVNAGWLRNTRARVYLRKNDFAHAVTELDAGIALEPNDSVMYANRCRAKVSLGDIAGGFADCEQAIKLEPRNAGGYIARGNAWLAKGDADQALADFERAIRLNPNFIQGYAGRAAAAEKKGDLESARADYRIVTAKLAAFETFEIKGLRQTAREHLAALTPSAVPPPPPALPTASQQPKLATGLSAPGPGVMGRRVALVIGNGAYKSVAALPNPPRDADAVAKALRDVGFTVVQAADNLGRDTFLQALRAFGREAEKSDWAVVYYAGHGMEVGGVNYLIPVDVKFQADTDVEKQAVSLELVIAAVTGAKKLRLVVLDACRNNPFDDTMTRTIGLRLVNKGLSNIEPDAGIMVVYAAKHGQTALDGEGGHSPFTAAFIKDLATPGLEVRRLFDVVRDDVVASTKKEQQPFTYGSLPGRDDFYFVAAK